MNWADFLLAVATPPGWSAVWWLVVTRVDRDRFGAFLAGWVTGIAGSALIVTAFRGGGWWSWDAGLAVSLVAAAAVWWWRRHRDKRRALAAWGGKTRARLAVMLRALREKARPRPVLRPGRLPA